MRPEDEGGPPPDETPNGQNWYAVHTRSRHEKMVAELLDEHGFERFLPLVKVLSQWKDRKKWVDRPYFPGYLFVHVAADELHLVRPVRGVAKILGPKPREASIVPEREIESLKRLVNAEVEVDPFPYLKPGQLVTIKRGVLKGVQGTIVKKSKRVLLVVSVPLLGQSVSVTIPAEDAEGL